MELLATTKATGGQRTAAYDVVDGAYLRFSPIDGSLASRSQAFNAFEARQSANVAARAFGAWSSLSGEARAEILLAAIPEVQARSAQLIALMQAEVGATKTWADFNIQIAIGHLLEAAAMARDLAPIITQDGDETHLQSRVPVGVCLAMAPWNAPFVLGMRAVVYALACGNAVVLKASEMCPATHLMIKEVLIAAGVPADVMQVITHAPEEADAIVTALIEHEAVRRVNFTGSSRVGRLVAEKAARALKRCLLELGGKDALIVLEDADLEAAADAAAFGAFFNQGQVCMATERVIVLDQIADAFVAKLVARAAKLKAGDPKEFPLGPMVNETVAGRVEALVQSAIFRGAKLLIGGQRRGTYMDATVLDDVTPGMGIYDEECFGPVIGICRAASVAEAISIANDTRYGLSAAIYGADIDQAAWVAGQLETGMCHINGPTLYDRPDMPVGGVKDSGYGRFGGGPALDEFTELRWVSQTKTARKLTFAAWLEATQQDPGANT